MSKHSERTSSSVYVLSAFECIMLVNVASQSNYRRVHTQWGGNGRGPPAGRSMLSLTWFQIEVHRGNKKQTSSQLILSQFLNSLEAMPAFQDRLPPIPFGTPLELQITQFIWDHQSSSQPQCEEYFKSKSLGNSLKMVNKGKEESKGTVKSVKPECLRILVVSQKLNNNIPEAGGVILR